MSIGTPIVFTEGTEKREFTPLSGISVRRDDPNSFDESLLQVLGIGQMMDELIEEYQKIKSSNYQLNFTYPTETIRRKLNIINRDMTASERQSTITSIKSLNKTLDDIEAGRLMFEDLPEKKLERLRILLSDKSNHG